MSTPMNAETKDAVATLRRVVDSARKHNNATHFDSCLVAVLAWIDSEPQRHSEKTWRCFLCDEVFTTETDARDHFSDGHERPGCVDPLAKHEKARLKELRDARELARHALSDAEVAISTARARGDHLAQLRAERDRMEAQRDEAEARLAAVREATTQACVRAYEVGSAMEDCSDLIVEAGRATPIDEGPLPTAPASSTQAKPPPALVVRTAGECVFWVANGRGWLLEAGRWVPLDVAPGLAGTLLTAREVEQLVADVGCPP